jgi:hypothetical protein
MTRVIMPRLRVWFLEAPAGVTSSGPLIVNDIDNITSDCDALIAEGWLVTGPYVLDPAAAVQAQSEVLAYKKFYEDGPEPLAAGKTLYRGAVA